jgi:signal transduction histidine kinase
MEPLTIFRCVVLASDDEVLASAEREYDARVEAVPLESLRVHALASLARGPVLLVALDDHMATAGLACGVDEVLRAGEITPASLRAAVDRATIRARARASPEFRRALLEEDEDIAFAMLATSIRENLQEPLAMASFDCDLLWASLPPVLAIGDEFSRWAMLSIPTEELRRLVARRAAAPATSEVRDMLDRLRAALARARDVVALVRELAAAGGGASTDCGQLACDVARLLESETAGVARLNAVADGRCRTPVARSAIVVLLASLIARSLSALRSAHRADGHIHVHVFEAEGAVVLEVRDDGPLTRADLRPEMLEGMLFDTGTHRTGLPALRDRVRRWGGDLLVDTDAEGTSVRAILPAAAESAVDPLATIPAPPRGTQTFD